MMDDETAVPDLWKETRMSKRGWIILSTVVGTVVILLGTSAGFAAYIHRARKAATKTAREAFDPYYAIIQYLRASDGAGEEVG